MSEEVPMNEGKKFKFRSDSRRTVVYRDDKAVAEFADHVFETDDPNLAAYLKEREYQEWDLITEDDIITFEGGSISLKELAKEAPDIAKSLLGLPKLLAKKAASKIPAMKDLIDSKSKPGDDSKDDAPPSLFICEFCGRDDFKSQPALNGHKANCPKKPPKE
ncbi:MAG: hypothetical protein KAQ99_02310 [Candidatus Aureabacteria bacterium]|nr:hypothetical protein [Candidatus Auribacterota bacterium]